MEDDTERRKERSQLLWLSPAFAVYLAGICYGIVTISMGELDISHFIKLFESGIPQNPVIVFVLYLLLGLPTAFIEISERTSKIFVYVSIVILVLGMYVGIFFGVNHQVQLTSGFLLLFFVVFLSSVLISLYITRKLMAEKRL